MTSTVGTASQAGISGEEAIRQTPNAEVRQELIRLINQTAQLMRYRSRLPARPS